jgi:uncharacterized protein (TIGR03437 family)
MAHITQTGKFHFGLIRTRIFLLIAIATLASTAAFGQNCVIGESIPTVHKEGLAEQIGDITLSCTGGTSGENVITYFNVSLNATITNRLDANANVLGVTASVNGTAATGVQISLTALTALTINGIEYTVPTPSTQTVLLRISGIRVAVPTVSGSNAPFVAGSLQGAGVLITNGPQVLLGSPAPSLLSSVIDYGIPCSGSALPATIDFPTFISSGVSSSTIRITEATPNAFVPKNAADPTVSNGVRFLVNLSSYSANSRVFVPDAIVGSTGTAPTSGGAFATTISGGTYTPNSNQLLLARVNGADATGAGGTLAFTLPASQTSFTSLTEITLTGGAAYAVYEVVDSNVSVTENAQIPVFLVVPPNNCSTSGQVSIGAMLAPVSNVSIPTQTDPILRFIATTPASDCTVIGDCSASYFPLLEVTPATVTLNGSSLGEPQLGFVTVGNGGSSQLTFNATTTYQPAAGQSVANWLSVNGTTATTVTGSVDPLNGVTSLTLKLSASPAALLVPGAYLATVTINAGSAGTVAVNVIFNVAAAGPVIQSVVNAANFQMGPVTAGSFVAIFGLNLAKKNTISVTFDGFPGNVSYDSPPGTANPTQINVLVPSGLMVPGNAGVIATIDGVVSNTFPIGLVTNAPAVFTPGILNQDNTVNLAGAPASLGDEVQIFLTGLATPVANPAAVTVNIGPALNLPNAYVGAVPSIPGLEQVNVVVPTTLTFSGGSAPLSICIPGTTSGSPLCTVPVSLYLH